MLTIDKIFRKNSLTKGGLDALEVRAIPLHLNWKQPETQGQRLWSELKNVFLLDPQNMHLLEAIVDRAVCHYEKWFTNTEDYIAGIYRPEKPWAEQTSIATVLTGHSGVGKTNLLKALKRSFDGTMLDEMKGYSCLPVTPFWVAAGSEKTSTSVLLENFILNCYGAESSKDIANVKFNKNRHGQAQTLAWRNRVCMVAIDEVQFATFGVDSVALPIKFLIQFLKLGPQLLYTANFSLINSFFRLRNPQEIRRLVTRPLVMHPHSKGSSPWIRLLNEFVKVSPEDFPLTMSELEGQVHDLSYGIADNCAHLMSIAWTLSKIRGGARAKVTCDDLAKAYCSPEYTSSRYLIEILNKHSPNDSFLKASLKNPFPGAEGDSEDSPHLSLNSSTGIDLENKAISDAYIRNQMKLEERNDVDFLNSSEDDRIPARKTQARTVDGLAENHERFVQSAGLKPRREKR